MQGDLFSKPKNLRSAYREVVQPTYRDPDPTIKKHGGVPTSKEAHRSLSDQQRSNMQKWMLAWIDPLICGATCDEVEHALGLSHQTCSARITELLKSGHLVPYLYKGIVRRRKTRSGRSARVYTTRKGDA